MAFHRVVKLGKDEPLTVLRGVDGDPGRLRHVLSIPCSVLCVFSFQHNSQGLTSTPVRELLGVPRKAE